MGILRCSKCCFEGIKRQALDHFLKRHTLPNEVPYYCTLCQFKGTTKAKWEKHLKKFPKHLSALKNIKTQLSGKSYLKCSNKPFNITIGNNGQLVPVSKSKQNSSPDVMNPVILEEYVSEIAEEVEIEEVVFEVMEEMDTSTSIFECDKNEEPADECKILALKTTLKKEREEFERYLTKCEKIKEELNTKLIQVEEKLIKEKQLRQNIVMKHNKSRKSINENTLREPEKTSLTCKRKLDFSPKMKGIVVIPTRT